MDPIHWQTKLDACLRRLCSLCVASCVLCGCSEKVCQPTPNGDLTSYDKCLARHESVKKATQVGPFTVLAISYDDGYGYYSTHLTYKQILYQGRSLATKVDDVQAWSGLSSTVLFANWYEGDGLGNSHLIYERAGQPIVERLDKGHNSWGVDYGFPYGYPLRHGVRYFPRNFRGHDAGFLLGVLPTRLTTLPLGLEGVNVPSVQSLAGIAPDGKAYAYTDSHKTPSAVVVVDADGTVRDTVPIPIISLASSVGPEGNPFEPVWRWFAATFTWQKDAHGRWAIVPTWAHAAIAPPANPVEELFIDAVAGYKSCFAGANPACLQGWRFLRDSAARCGDRCVSPYAYEPIKPTQAFDADVAAIIYSRSVTSDSGYKLLLNAPRDQVIAILTKRLKNRKVPFVRTDQCPNLASENAPCVARLKQTIDWKDQASPSLLWAIFSASENAAVFMTPTAAFAVYAAPNGRTWVDTIARYEILASQDA